MTRDEIFEKVRDTLVDALGVDDDEVTPKAVLTTDLGAESIDFLDIVFKLEQEFGVKISQGELFPDNVAQDPEFVQSGKVTEKGIETLRGRLPHADIDALAADPKVANVAKLFTTDTLVNFVQRKLEQL